MLTIAKMGRSRARYYANLAQNQAEFDPYKIGEKPGLWLGQGAAWMGLTGTVGREEFLTLFRGFVPDKDGQKLVQSAGQANHCPGWDCTFLPPKSFSVAWAVASPEMQAELEAILIEATKAAISYLEDHAEVRRGKEGRQIEDASLIVAAFEHCTSRNLDPCLHIHSIILNSGIGDQESHALNSSFLYKHKMAAGAIYRAELASRLEQELGIAVQREQSWFELKGFSRHRGPYKALMNEWSSRRVEIESMQPKTPKQAQAAAYMTRAKKETDISREELMEKWREVAATHGLTADKVQALAHEPRERSLLNSKWQEWCAVREARVDLVNHKSHFTHRDVVRAIAEAAQGRGLNSSDVLRLTDKYLASNQVMDLGLVKGEQRFTTKRLYKLEQSLMKEIDSLSGMRSPRVANRYIEAVISSRGLNEEQAQSLRGLCDSRSLQVLSGISGTGKTRVLGSVADVYRKNGYQVLGVATSGERAQAFGEQAGIGSQNNDGGDYRRPRHDEEQCLTLFKLFNDIDRARSNETPSPLSRRTLVVVDDAHAISTAQMLRLANEVRAARAKLILSGDVKGLQSYEHAGAFSGVIKHLHERLYHPTFELKTSQRQLSEQDREIVQQVASGQVLTVLKTLTKRGQLTLAADYEEGVAALVSTWADKAGLQPRDHLLIVDSPDDATLVNRKAQAALKESGVLTGRSVRVNKVELHVGDRVRFNQSYRLDGIAKGDMGQVTKVGWLTGSITVKLDSGTSRVIYTGTVTGIDLGYALTARQAQALEPQHAYALTRGMGRENALAHLSRAQSSTHLVCYDVEPSSPLWEVASQLKYERTVKLAIDVQEQEQEQEEEQLQQR